MQQSRTSVGTRAIRAGRGRRRALALGTVLALITAGAAPGMANAAATTADGGTLDWGLRSSFRTYITSPIAHGTITPSGGATQKSGNGTFVFSGGSGTVDPTAGTATLRYSGTVAFAGHDSGSGPQLSMSLASPSIAVVGSTATLTATLSSKSLSSGSVVNYGAIPFATFPVASGSSLTPDATGLVTLRTGAGKLTSQGVPAFADFYLPPDNDFVDPLTLTAQLTPTSPTNPTTPTTPTNPTTPTTPTTPTNPAVPTVTVSKSTVDPEGDTVTVTGTGFDPAASIGTRPPLAGRPAGVYVAFGTFLDVWKPSAGAPATARKTGPQSTAVKWAVLAGDRATVGQDISATLAPDGSFSTTVQVSKDFDGALADGNYGIYTYPGSGASAPSFETYTPLTFATAPTAPGTGTAAQTIVATIVNTGGLTLSVDNSTVTLPVPTLSADGSKLSAIGALNPVRVTDLRAANPGWSVSGQLSDFTTTGGSFDGKYLGWTPSVTSSAVGQTVVAGNAVVAGNGTGLKGSAALGTSVATKGRGTAVLRAGLALELPSETAPGTYSATLTLTAI